MTPKKGKTSAGKRKQGAQPGNKNAQKHGFYAKRFETEEKERLEGIETMSIESEIELLRVCMDRLTSELDFSAVYLKDKNGGDLDLRDDHYLKQLNTLGIMSASLSTLIRTHYLTKGKGGQVEQSIMDALEELRIEMGL